MIKNVIYCILNMSSNLSSPIFDKLSVSGVMRLLGYLVPCVCEVNNNVVFRPQSGNIYTVLKASKKAEQLK